MRINIVIAIPESSSTFGRYRDGFTAAIEVLQEQHEIRWLNVHPANPDAESNAALIPDADVVFIKSDWGWLPAQASDRALQPHPEVAAVLVISGSTPPPPLTRMLRYDALVYETQWYERFVHNHPLAVRAFGVDTRVMQNQGVERDVDWVFIGRGAAFKRPERLLEKSGRRIAVGDFSASPAKLLDAFHDAGIEIAGHKSPVELADLLNRTKSVLVPCELQGGGERAVLEARACGCTVEVARDNPKLLSLMDIDVPSHEDYAHSLGNLLELLNAGQRVDPALKSRAHRAESRAILLDKLRRTPKTLWIRVRNIMRRSH